MDELKSLSDAYAILAKLFSQAWAEPVRVPTPVSLVLLHAREHLGLQIEQYLICEPEREGSAPVVEPVRRAA